MSEIRFACPYCDQHIACDGDYGGLSIDCPGCGNTMVVPRLSAADSSHPAILLVASKTSPGPKPDTLSPLPTVTAWTEEQWAEHSKEINGSEDGNMPHWMAAFFATLMVAFVLKIGHAGLLPILGCLFLGGVISALLLAKSQKRVYNIFTALTLIVAIVCLLPVIALGILFVGCMGCG